MEASDLDFTTPDQDPVTLISVTPPATLDGNVVTTDPNGDATVQFNLGTVRTTSFLRAEEAP